MRILRALKGYIYAAGLVAAITFGSRAIWGQPSPTNPAMLYLLAVVIAALRWGRGSAILAAVAGAFACDYFFVPPLYSLALVDLSSDLLTFMALLGVGLVISTLTARARDQAERARQREAATAALYSLSEALAATVDARRSMEIVGQHVAETFARPVAVLLPSERGLEVSFRTAGFELSPEHAVAAEAAFKRAEMSTASDGAGFFPMKVSGAAAGVLAVQPLPAPAQRPLLEAFASQAALALERARLQTQARQAQLLEETGRLQRALLNSVSHNLRTPLASITSALSSLEGEGLDEAGRSEVLRTAIQEAARLNRLVGNLLDMTRLEYGRLRLRLAPCDVQDIIGAAISQLGEGARQRRILVQAPLDLPLVEADFTLVEQVLVNLIDNAMKYSPAEAPVEVRAGAAGGQLRIEVADHGCGIAPEDTERAFQKFERLSNPHPTRGLGLGLSIAKGFVEAHGGRISIQPNTVGGTVVSFTLPLDGGKGAMLANEQPVPCDSDRR